MSATLTQKGPAEAGARQYYLTEEHHPENGTMLGFWIYLMSDLLIFACLFATYGVLGRNYAAGVSGRDIFDLKLVALNTAMLLFSSITYGYAVISMQEEKLGGTLRWLGLTALFGLGFLCIEIYEFHHMIEHGASPQRSAFLSSLDRKSVV